MLETKFLLKELILNKCYLTLHDLNHVIEQYELGYMETKERPSRIQEKSIKIDTVRKLGQSGNAKVDLCLYLHIPASQMWLLSRLLPVMIGHKIPESDSHWLNYLLLLRITDYLFSPVICYEDCSYLKVL